MLMKRIDNGFSIYIGLNFTTLTKTTSDKTNVGFCKSKPLAISFFSISGIFLKSAGTGKYPSDFPYASSSTDRL